MTAGPVRSKHPLAPPVAGDDDLIVVAALSARSLAQGLHAAGRRVIALDLFGDADTRESCLSWDVLQRQGTGAANAGKRWRLDGDALLGALRALAGSFGRARLSLLLGAGIEHLPNIGRDLAAVCPEVRLLGCSDAVRAHLRSGVAWCERLDRLGIAQPPWRVARGATVPTQGRWLVRRPGHCGGAGLRPVRRAQSLARVGAEAVLQRREIGVPMSLTFFADRHGVHPVGLNRLQCGIAGAPFIFIGATGPVRVPHAAYVLLVDIARRLIADTGMLGLGSLDVLHAGTWSNDEDRCQKGVGTRVHTSASTTMNTSTGPWLVLELNARPTATLELHDPDGAWLARHVALFREAPGSRTDTVLPQTVDVSTPVVRSFRVLHAPEALRWPWSLQAARDFMQQSCVRPVGFSGAPARAWLTDLPDRGVVVPAGAPLCTLHVECATDSEVPSTMHLCSARLFQALAANEASAANAANAANAVNAAATHT